MPTPKLPPLRHITQSTLSHLSPPTTKIRTDDDVQTWRDTQGYKDYGLFLRSLNESVKGYSLPYPVDSASEAIKRTLAILEELDRWIDEIPPLSTPQRFGNLAFRTWGRRLEEHADEILINLLPSNLRSAIPMLSPYLLTSFGSFTRMDYGTGHETSFALLLLSLTLIRFFDPSEEEERHLVLTVFDRYVRLCWKLQDMYQLEPAGSHGVWGLDDFTFISYIFGSGQLRGNPEIAVSSILANSPLPQENLYYKSINRINEVKRGPFHEHSSQLHSIAIGVPTWDKVNSGLFKMYEAEILGKRVVVQHLPLGGLLEWDVVSTYSQAGEGMRAPWAQTPSLRHV